MTPVDLVVRVRTEPLSAGARAALADSGRDPAIVDRWFDDGEVWALVDPAVGDGPVAAAVATVDDDVVRVRVVHPVDGSRRLVAGLADRYRAGGARRMAVTVGEHQLDLLAAMLAAGFRLSHVEPAACDGDRGWLVDRPRDGLSLLLEL